VDPDEVAGDIDQVRHGSAIRKVMAGADAPPALGIVDQVHARRGYARVRARLRAAPRDVL
jgi:hypothetical protein